MNFKTKTATAIFLLLCAVSCRKENLKSPVYESLQSSANSDAVTSFTIGQAYHGGIIFYIDKTGNHGLIAAVSDQGTGISWRKNKML